MARFETAYEGVKKWEGGYSNIAADKGGETYAGISRKFFPTWSGWQFIDQQTKPIKRNTIFPALTENVKNFYRLAFWNKYNLGNIVDQKVANLIFDFVVNSGETALTKIRSMFGIAKGANLIEALNKFNPATVYTKIKNEREIFYKELAQKPGQEQFLKGWLNRLNSFPDYAKSGIANLLLFIIVGLIFLILN